jgi:hypothetical protein
MSHSLVMPAKAGIHADSEWTPLIRIAMSPGHGYEVRGTSYLINFAGVTG